MIDIQNGFSPFFLEHFRLETLVIDSQVLKNNPLGDSPFRFNPVLVPKVESSAPWPVVVWLSGFTGNGPASFNSKAFELNHPQTLDREVAAGRAPQALYVFVDAMTFWGGSQFLNSPGTGRYQDYVLKEVVPALRSRYPVQKGTEHWCVAGGSSGGYGALHLATVEPGVFGCVAALAPDSFFEASLLPEIRTALPFIRRKGGVAGIKKSIREEGFAQRREAHTVLNAIGMGTCYAPSGVSPGDVDWPIDPHSGELLPETWKRWLAHDPIVFLAERKKALSQLVGIKLDVGDQDQFQLQYGTRQLYRLIQEMGLKVDESEFSGNHFDLSARRPEVWTWLKSLWS